jgi:CheY-like chemotaxis protein
VAASISPEPVWINGDAVRLEQVIANLIDNASKYSDPGGQIWIELNRELNEAVLRVRDSGIGISPETLPIIFELFTQADKSLDRAQGGLGIGLALVHSIVTLHHGKVEAHSTLGQGSEFVVRLPLRSSAPIPDSVARVDSPHAVRSLELLVVDDNRDAAAGLARLLRSFGHSVQVANDASQAMQWAREHTPEMVLLDIGLPVINGYDLAKWFRQQPELKEVMLVAVTGYGQKSDMALSQEAGINHHLVKPVDFAKVESILSAVAEKAPLNRRRASSFEYHE